MLQIYIYKLYFALAAILFAPRDSSMNGSQTLGAVFKNDASVRIVCKGPRVWDNVLLYWT